MAAAPDASSARLLSSILNTLKEMKETQKIHTKYLQSLLRQQAMQPPSGDDSVDLDLPVKTMADFDAAEEKLRDSGVRKRLVSQLVHPLHPQIQL